MHATAVRVGHQAWWLPSVATIAAKDKPSRSARLSPSRDRRVLGWGHGRGDLPASARPEGDVLLLPNRRLGSTGRGQSDVGGVRGARGWQPG